MQFSEIYSKHFNSHTREGVTYRQATKAGKNGFQLTHP